MCAMTNLLVLGPRYRIDRVYAEARRRCQCIVHPTPRACVWERRQDMLVNLADNGLAPAGPHDGGAFCRGLMAYEVGRVHDENPYGKKGWGTQYRYWWEAGWAYGEWRDSGEKELAAMGGPSARLVDRYLCHIFCLGRDVVRP